MNTADPDLAWHDEKPGAMMIHAIEARKDDILRQCNVLMEGLVRHTDVLQKELEAQSVASLLLKGLDPQNSAHHEQIIRSSQIVYRNEHATYPTLSEAFDKSWRSFETKSEESLFRAFKGRQPPFMQAVTEAMRHTKGSSHAVAMNDIIAQRLNSSGLPEAYAERLGEMMLRHQSTDAAYRQDTEAGLTQSEDSFLYERQNSFGDNSHSPFGNTKETLAVSDESLQEIKSIRQRIENNANDCSQSAVRILHEAERNLKRHRRGLGMRLEGYRRARRSAQRTCKDRRMT